MSGLVAGIGINALLGRAGAAVAGVNWRRILPWLAAAAGALALVLAIRSWGYHAGVAHERPLAEARGWRKGSDEQLAADRRAVTAAFIAAAAQQHTLVETTAARAGTITKEKTDALRADNDRLSRSYADLRLRWTSAREATAGGPGQDGAASLPVGVDRDADAACKARGWVDFDTAAAASEAADRATALSDIWQRWYAEQAVAWPKP